jgi:hypothetical protein
LCSSSSHDESPLTYFTQHRAVAPVEIERGDPRGCSFKHFVETM